MFALIMAGLRAPHGRSKPHLVTLVAAYGDVLLHHKQLLGLGRFGRLRGRRGRLCAIQRHAAMPHSRAVAVRDPSHRLRTGLGYVRKLAAAVICAAF